VDITCSEPDTDLVRRAREGDRDAFALLLGRHIPTLRRVCRRVLGLADGLEDVVQEAALQALLGIDSLREPGQFGAWLVGIGLNVARRGMRYQARDAWSWEALRGGSRVAEPADATMPEPDAAAEAAELSRLVRAAVADLPEGQRAAVLLVYLSGLTYRETAAALGIQVSAVKTRLHKGRASLQRRLWNLWKEYVVTTSVEQEMVEVRVTDVRRRQVEEDKPPRSVIVLREVDGERMLPIWVGQWEGHSIAMLLEKVKVPRPLTFAFTASLLRAGGVRVESVRVHRLVDETYYAQAVLNGPAGEAVVDARPSDCIALALELGAPIYAAAEVLNAAEAARLALAALRGPAPAAS
jgi:RNA polymerase sigma factor (sigma-70 family)